LGYLVDEIDANTYSAQMQRLRNQGWYQRSTVQSTISRLLSVGDIEKTIKNGRSYYRLTSKGSERIKEDVPLLKLAEKSWDGKWRMVIFDIKEKYRRQREGLRRKLLSLGFGMWQESVYITPFDIAQEVNQYLLSQKLFPHAICLVAKRNEVGDEKILANYIWKLDKEILFSNAQGPSRRLTAISRNESSSGGLRKSFFTFHLLFCDQLLKLLT